MLTWTAIQPLPERLLELLDRAGAQVQRFGSHDDNTVIIFLPPHLVLGSKEICFRSFRSGFEELHALSQSKDNADYWIHLKNFCRVRGMPFYAVRWESKDEEQMEQITR